MLNKDASISALKNLFRRSPIADLDALFHTLQTRSRMSVFRRLRLIGYFSSFTHTGRYYTLEHIPQFDHHGLWLCQGIGFSRLGSLKATIVALVEKAPAGYSHAELELLLRVRVHNTLLALVRKGRVGRQGVGSRYLYVSVEPGRAAEQATRRGEQFRDAAAKTDELPASTVIEVLVEALHTGQVEIVPSLVAQRLSARGAAITVSQVEDVFARYGIDTGKKMEGSDSMRSQA